MEIRADEKVCIFTPLAPRLDERECGRLFAEIEAENKVSAIDLSHVHDCTMDFIEGLKRLCSFKKIGIFNIPSDIFVLFNIMKLDRCAKLFVSELDFGEDSRQMINRNFRVL